MKNKIIKITCFLILIYSCNKNKNAIKIRKDITFDIGYNYSSSGTYYDKAEATTYIYFADFVSKKCIKTFDLNGKKVDSISLKEATEILEDINSITILSLDTILINSMHTNQLVIIDRNGCVWKNLNLNPLLNDYKGNHYEMASSGQNILKNGSLLFRSYWNFNSIDQKNKAEPENNLDFLKYYYFNCFNAPHFIVLSNMFSERPKIQFLQEGFYKNLSSSPDIFSESPNYSVLNNSVYDFSVYSDCLFRSDQVDLGIEKRIEIKSDYTKIGIKPLSINEETIQLFQEKMNKGYWTKGFISNVFYNQVDKEYYVLVFHEIKKETVSSQNLYRNFSVIIYNASFTEKKEYCFREGIYKSGYSIMTSEGLIMPKKINSNKTISDGKTVFTLFQFN